MARPIAAFLSIVVMLNGCCPCKKPDQQRDRPCTQPTDPDPGNEEPIDGSQRYPARAAGPALFVVTLPHGTDATKIRRIEVWVHTDGMEAHRVNNKTTYDEIHLVGDNPPHATIVQDNVFRSVLSGPGPNEDLVTTGSAVGGGDVFELSEGSKEFDALVSPISRGVVYARLKPNLPKPKPPQVVSMSVKLTLKS